MSAILPNSQKEDSELAIILAELEEFSIKVLDHLKDTPFVELTHKIKNNKNIHQCIDWMLVKIFGAVTTSTSIPLIRILPHTGNVSPYIIMHNTAKLAAIAYNLDTHFNIKMGVQGNPTYRLNELSVVFQAYRKLF